jgi:hypothetical protein
VPVAARSDHILIEKKIPPPASARVLRTCGSSDAVYASSEARDRLRARIAL